MKKSQPAQVRAVIDSMQKANLHMPPMAQPGRMPDELANTLAMAKGRASMRNTKNIKRTKC